MQRPRPGASRVRRSGGERPPRSRRRPGESRGGGPLGGGAGPASPSPPAPPLGLVTVPLSPHEVDYPLVRAADAASALADGEAARAWLARGGEPAGARSGAVLAEPGRRAPLGAATGEASRGLGETILRRGSTREFRRDPITRGQLAAILDAALRPLPLDLADAEALVETYLLVHAVEGLDSGAYVWDPAARGLRLLKAGDFRREGGELCLDQALGADASVVAFFLSDLDAVLTRWGSRGYRAVNLAAGLLGGRALSRRVRARTRGHRPHVLRRRRRAVLRAGRGWTGGHLRHGPRPSRAPAVAAAHADGRPPCSSRCARARPEGAGNRADDCAVRPRAARARRSPPSGRC